LEYIVIDETLASRCDCGLDNLKDEPNCLGKIGFSRKDIKEIRKSWCYIGDKAINEYEMTRRLMEYLTRNKIEDFNFKRI